MSVLVVAPNCLCETPAEWSKTVLSEVRLCEEHHRYWKGGKELVSVSEIIRSTWAFKSNFSQAKPSVLANALSRGIQVDRLISKYLSNDLKVLPKGTRFDAAQLFLKFRRWWFDHKHGDIQTQVLVHDDSVGGMMDIRDVRMDKEGDAVF